MNVDVPKFPNVLKSTNTMSSSTLKLCLEIELFQHILSVVPAPNTKDYGMRAREKTVQLSVAED